MTDEQFNTTAIFGEVKKHILSKDFKSGTVTNLCGTTTIDFCNADINGTVILESTQLFGEIRIKAPANWHIVPEVTNIFMVVDDKRRSPTLNIDATKILILKGVGIFASIKIVDCFS